jgi:hypothetical protein
MFFNYESKPRTQYIFSMSHIRPHPCTICGNAGHNPSHCKELGIPPNGFYKPSPGMHQHDDDEDESMKQINRVFYLKVAQLLSKCTNNYYTKKHF